MSSSKETKNYWLEEQNRLWEILQDVFLKKSFSNSSTEYPQGHDKGGILLVKPFYFNNYHCTHLVAG